MSRKLPGEKNYGYRKLRVWQKVKELAVLVYHLTDNLSRRDWWLRSEMCRAALSVTGNIAEGYCRRYLADYLRFLDIARGSLGELGNYINFACEIGVASNTELNKLDHLYNETGYLLDKLISALESKSKAGDWERGMTVREESLIYNCP
jgi:four helix bundle protein